MRVGQQIKFCRSGLSASLSRRLHMSTLMSVARWSRWIQNLSKYIKILYQNLRIISHTYIYVYILMIYIYILPGRYFEVTMRVNIMAFHIGIVPKNWISRERCGFKNAHWNLFEPFYMANLSGRGFKKDAGSMRDRVVAASHLNF